MLHNERLQKESISDCLFADIRL